MFRNARTSSATVALLAALLWADREGVAGAEKRAEPLSAKPAKGYALAPNRIALSIEAPSTRGPWTMHVKNEDDVPVILAADARLLTLDVTPRGAHRAEHCELPWDMRPQDDLERPLVLPPHREYEETFEPRLYCLSGKQVDALAPAAIVVATLGWSGRGSSPPLAVASIAGVEPQVAPSKSIVAPPIVLPDDPTPPAPPALVSTEDLGASADAKLSVSSVRSIDAASPNDIVIPVTLRNEGTRAVVLRFRPETLAFDVVGPAGTSHCAWPTNLSAPTRDLFTTLAPQRDLELVVLLSAYCPTRVLERAGLFVVRPSVDTRHASGADVGIRSFEGEVIATSPTVVRLRRGLHPVPLVRPHLVER